MYDLSVVFGEPVNKLEKRIPDMSEEEARHLRYKLDDAISYDKKFVSDKNIQGIWLKLNHQMKEAGELSKSDWEEQSKTEVAKDILAGGTTSTMNIWKNKVFKSLIIKNQGLPSSVSVETARKLKPEYRYFGRQTFASRGMLNKEGRVELDDFMGDIMTEYGIYDTHPLEVAQEQSKALYHLYMQSKKQHSQWKPNEKAVGQYILGRIAEVQNKRSPRAKAIDDSMTTDIVVKKNDPRWFKSPNRYDIRGVDTKKRSLARRIINKIRKPKVGMINVKDK
jgi:hypothetical protein